LVGNTCILLVGRRVSASLLCISHTPLFVAKAFEFRDRFSGDNYWVVVTETHLCVLSKRNGLAMMNLLLKRHP
jgi:hypothetical protein